MDTMNEVIGERSSFIGFSEFGLLQRGQQFALHFEISSYKYFPLYSSIVVLSGVAYLPY